MADDTKPEIIFVLGDELPTNYDVAIAIYKICTKHESEKMKHCILSYAAALRTIWVHAFGEEHVMDTHTIKTNLKHVLNHYRTHVYNEKNRTKPKKKGTPFVKKRSRVLHQEWRQMSMSFTKNRQRHSIPINSLFKCGKDIEKLTGVEKDFYKDQTGVREGRISETIDDDYVTEKNDELIKEERDAMEVHHALGDEEGDEEDVSSTNDAGDGNQLNVSVNRSGHIRSTAATAEVGIQCEGNVTRPKIRSARNCTKKVKSTCTEVAVKCYVSNQTARVAFQTVCSSFYGHEYYLTKEDAIERDPDLKELRTESSTEPKPPKRSKTKEKSSIPHTTTEWKAYQNVIPSTRTLNDHKHVLAIQHEKDAAVTLNNIPEGTKVTLHYDTTSRSQIDGDWPALILIFSNGRRYPLRPLFFAYEDRIQIIRLIVETYNRLAATISSDEHPVTAKVLWEKTTALMTDSVTKNLKIGEGAAEKFGSSHVPYHLLCKSHTVEGFDRSNLAGLASVEKELKFREKLIAMNPGGKSFLRGKSVVESAIISIVSLVNHDKSAHSTNQADLFDHILEREDQVKHIAMYYERRFTKLGYSAASIIQALPYLCMLLNESHLSNQHIEIVRMFLDSEFLITELEVLAYFTHVVTLPFLYFVEVNSQEELLEMFPRLFNDLKCGSMDTLIDYRIEYPHVNVIQPTSDLSQQLLKKMCVDAAAVLDLQAGREYGFGEGVNLKPRATQLHLLSPEDRAGLSTNNLDAERHLHVFGKRAPVAKFRNKRFTAKGIRNDVTLFQSETLKNEQSKGFISIVKLLNSMEKDWVGEQKELQKLKILEKIERGKQSSQYTQKCLQQCKEWKGPATSVEELNAILIANTDRKEKIVRIELSYYRDTHKPDVIEQPDLFKIQKISYDEQLLNLCSLLAVHVPCYVSLPSNKDAEIVLSSSSSDPSTSGIQEDPIELNKYYVTLITEGDKDTWYIASCEAKNPDGTYKMEHLHRVQEGSNLKWKHPSRVDESDLYAASIVECVVDGDWDVSQKRNLTFTLRNHAYISNLVKNLF